MIGARSLDHISTLTITIAPLLLKILSRADSFPFFAKVSVKEKIKADK